MIALTPGNIESPTFLAGFHEVLPRQFECRLHCFGSAAQEHGLTHTRRQRDEQVTQLLEHLRGKKCRVRVRQPGGLLLNSLDDGGMVVAQAGHGSTTAAVEVALAVSIEQVNAFAARCQRWIRNKTAMQDMTHGTYQ